MKLKVNRSECIINRMGISHSKHVNESLKSNAVIFELKTSCYRTNLNTVCKSVVKVTNFCRSFQSVRARRLQVDLLPRCYSKLSHHSLSGVICLICGVHRSVAAFLHVWIRQEIEVINLLFVFSFQELTLLCFFHYL